MSNPPPGLGGGVARTGPPPGFAAAAGNGPAGSTNANNGSAAGGPASPGGASGTAAIVRAQIVFLLTTFTEDSFDKAASEIRALASTHGPEMYHHFVRRTAVVAAPVIQVLIQHSQQYKDDPAAPPPQIPTSGPAALAWRLLATEAVRAARDVALAPHFVLTMLSPSQGTPLPLPSLRLFNLPPAIMFSLSALTLSNPQVFPSTHPSHDLILQTLHQTFQSATELLRSGVPFWSTNIPNLPQDDLTLQEARTLMLAVYPRPSSSGSTTGVASRPPTPTNPTSPHPSPLNSPQRGYLLQSLTIKFTSPAIVLQTLSTLSPGGPPRTPGSIPLEDILFELGDNLTGDSSTVEAVISRWWGPYLLEEPNQQAVTDEIIRTLHGLCRGLQDGRAVDFHGVISGICATTSVPWIDIVSSFDMPQSPLAHPSALPLAASLLLVPPQTPVSPLAGLLPASPSAPSWTNLSSLLYVLRNLSTLAPDSLPLFTLPTSPSPETVARIVEPYAPDAHVSKIVRQQAKDVQAAGLWNTLGLIQVLIKACALADSEDASDREELVDIGRRATELLDRAASLAPELVLIALEKLPKPLPTPITTMHSKILEVYLINPPSALASPQLVFQKLWELNPTGLLDVLAEFYGEDENNLGKVVEIAWDLQILDKLLASDNLHFALDVASLSSSKEYFTLEDWLADSVAVNGDDFLQAMFDFVEHKVRLEIDHQHQPESVPPPHFTLSDEAYSIFIRVIRNAENLTAEDIRRFKTLRTDVLILHPRLLNLRPGSKDEQGFQVAAYSKAITSQVDEMYRQMYSEDNDLTLDKVIEDLKAYQKSDDQHERELFAAALHSLFDEYKFIKTYPQRELAMTGILFGAIIDYRLVKDTPAFVATRYVLDACKTPPHEPPYQFGISALSVLRASLVDFPGLCRSLLEIPALHESHPSYINDIHAALNEREELDLQGGVKLAFPALKLPVLIEEGDDEFKEPDPKLRDQFMFIINQIAPSNYEQKSQDLLKIFEPQYSRWFAHYFIDVRVSLEANRHDLYIQLLDLINSPLLDKHVLWETYRKARDLLNAESTVASSADRTTLKTIALWLGRITLARQLPIKHRELTIKDLLVQGYDNKRLIVAIPFVCNIMIACKDSPVFHIPNPWFHAIIRVLVELYHYGDLKLNMKFEIEVLFSKLDIQLESVEPSDLIRTHTPPPQPQTAVPNRLEVELQRQLVSNEVSNGGQRFAEPSLDDPFARIQAMQSEQAAQAAHAQFLENVDELVRQLPEYLHFNSDLGVLQAPTFKRIVLHSIERAIREIVTPVVERSVTIAGISSRDLVQKDFGTEGDSGKMRKAAHLMVQNLAGNLALVTCKEPLRTSLMNNIRTLVGQNGFTEENVPDAVIAGVVNENLDVACDIIRKAAMEKAVRDIDVNLQPQFAARKAHRDARSQQPFWDGASFGVAISHTALPDPLRLRQGGLTPTQLRVYEDFGETARALQQQQQAQQQQAQQQQQQLQSAHVNGGADNYPVGYRDLGLGDGGLPPPEVKRGPSPRYNNDQGEQVLPPHATVDKFHEIIAEIEKQIAHSSATAISQLEQDHDLHSLTRTVIVLAHSSVQREATTLAIAQKVVQLLYKTESPLGREIYVVLLRQLCQYAPKVNREVRQWLVYAEDARKFNVPVTVVLIRAEFIRVAELDAQLAKMMGRGFTPDVLDFTAQLIRECSLDGKAFIPRNGFAASITALLKAQEVGQSTQAADQLLEDLRGDSVGGAKLTPIDPKVHERLQHYFFEWVRLFSENPNTPEVSFVPYITWLQNENILGGEDVSTAFYTTAIKAAVECDTKSEHWYGTDALAKLIILIVKNYGDKSGPGSVTRTVYYFNKIVTIMSYSLVRAQLDTEERFDQRPWTRFFTSMLSEINSIEASLPETSLGCLKSIANVLGIVQPTYAPRFAFGWISIISHRLFMSKLLGAPRQEGWADYHRCLMWLLRFVAPFISSASTELSPPARSLYRATLRILLVLMHDFPGFLVEYYHTLSTTIPAHCVQLRNIILAAFPTSEAALPDWYKRLDELVPDMQSFPRVRSDHVSALNSGNVKNAIDQYVHTGSPTGGAIVAELKNRIAVQKTLPDGTTTTVWNNTLLHATVFYIGTSAIQRHYMTNHVAEFDPKDPGVLLLVNLAHALDAEGQYLLLSVVADQLRFPSAHTLFFASFMLYLFKISTESAIPERIARVLLERVIVARPHPWGLIVTFVELLENPTYGFWDQPFVRADDEIFMMFRRARENFGTQMH